MTYEYEMFKKYLAENQLKVTPQRRDILETVFETHSHFDADQLVDMLKAKNKNISRATVYRVLELLVKSGLIRAMELGESRKVYEHIIGHRHHDHLVCVACGRAIEFGDGMIETLKQQICDEQGFKVEFHSLQIFGRCKNCR